MLGYESRVNVCMFCQFRPSTLPNFLISEAPQTIGFLHEVVTSSDIDLNFDPKKMVGSLVVTGSSRAQQTWSPQLWEQLTPEEK